MIGHAVFGPDAMSLYSRYHNGGLAQLVVVPQANVDELPDQITFDLGAKLHDFAMAVRASYAGGAAAGEHLGGHGCDRRDEHRDDPAGA